MESTALRHWSGIQTGIVLLVLVIGGILAMAWPVWFAPPSVSQTLWLYLGLLVLWFPLLIILVIRHRERSLPPLFILIAIGVVVTVIVLALRGPNLSAGALQAKDCTSSEVSPGQTEYVCTLVELSSRQTFTLHGPTGSPFVRLVSNKFTYNS